jgi:hypothetical protein
MEDADFLWRVDRLPLKRPEGERKPEDDGLLPASTILFSRKETLSRWPFIAGREKFSKIIAKI